MFPVSHVILFKEKAPQNIRPLGIAQNLDKQLISESGMADRDFKPVQSRVFQSAGRQRNHLGVRACRSVADQLRADLFEFGRTSAFPLLLAAYPALSG